MGQLLVYLSIAAVMAAAVIQPWIGVIAGYLVVLLGPQFIWWWNFNGIRPFYLIAVPTIVGLAVAFATNRARLAPLANKLTFLLVVWLCASTLSYLFGPYVHAASAWRFFEPDAVFNTLVKAFAFYFVAALCIDTDRKFRYLVYVGMIAILYLIYWANLQYLLGHYFGRLSGPRSPMGGLYVDENAFAMIFVVGLPLLYYAGATSDRKLIRYGLWATIPFGWHAIFLTGSRGGLIGLVVTLLAMAFRARRRTLGLLLIPAFVVVFLWQAGDVMKHRAQTIAEYEDQTSAQTRLDAWQAAARMVVSHPLLGVGLASFGPAFSDFSSKRPRAAHNTFLQLSAESGLFAGLAWVLAVLVVIRRLWVRSELPPAPDEDEVFVHCLNDAVLVSLLGFLACSTFLSLQGFEGFFYLLLLANYLLYRSGTSAPEPVCATVS